MSSALHHLFESPQNNFRIFENGYMVFSNESQSEQILTIIKSIFRMEMGDKE